MTIHCFRILSCTAILMVLCLTACQRDITVTGRTNEEVSIYPDYKDVTIPPNIAPLNFQALTEKEAVLVISSANGGSWQVRAGDDHLFTIPQKKWKELLAANRGSDITFTLCVKEGSEWNATPPFPMHVAKEEIDPYIAYRLIQPTYTFWNEMGIYQRNLETYSQIPVYQNKFTDYNCVNCHSFQSRDPGTMLFHMRAKHAGTVLGHDNTLEKLNTKTDETISALVYPYWHPTKDYLAFSVNATLQAFFSHYENVIEVFDNASDVVIYDTRKHEVFSSDLLKSDDAFETFPTFSPDGKSLYFCSALKVDSLPYTYKDVHYSLCRIEVDVENRTFGKEVDTLYNAIREGGSMSFPRISPDGKFLVATHHHAGNFSIWHPEADLMLFDLTDGSRHLLSEANSPKATDSYHSWSSNSRWLVFSSRRMDGLYTRPFFTYIDEQGNAHKPFVLPQDNPAKRYDGFFFSYNIPEFISGKVEVRQQDIASMMKGSKGVDVSYSNGK